MAKTKYKTIDEYISTFPENVQNILDKIRQMIRKEVPDATETISYGMPTFNLNGRYLIYFAAWKDHISVYPTPSGKVSFQDELSTYLSGKGTAKFPLNKPIPYELVRKIVLHRIKETSPTFKNAIEEKIQTLHPQGKNNKSIKKQHYTVIRQAILDALQDEEMTHTELVKELEKNLKGKFDGNISWSTMTVKLDLEARKIIERTSSRPQKYRLKTKESE